MGMPTGASNIKRSIIGEMFSEAIRLGAINLGSGDTDFSPPREALAAEAKAAIEGPWRYAPIEGSLRLRELISEKLKRENDVRVDPESEVTVTCGSSAAVSAAIMATVPPGSEVLVFEPFYAQYLSLINLIDALPVLVPIAEARSHRLGDILHSRASDETRAIIVNSPNNPSSKVFSYEALSGIAKFCVERDVLAVTDEVYEKIIYDSHEHYSLASFPGMRERTITCNSFSKTFSMGGYRIGYVATAEELTRMIRNVHSSLVLSSPIHAQAAACAALSDPLDYVSYIKKGYAERRDLALDLLGDIVDCEPPEGTFFVFINISELGVDDIEFCRRLLREQGVAVIPGSEFGSEGAGHIRVCFARNLPTLTQGLNRIRKMIEKLKRAKKSPSGPVL